MAQQPTTDSKMAQQPTTDSVLKEKEFEEGDDQDQCPVCLIEFNPKETVWALPCQHSFHRTCVDPWLRKYSPTCPVCRHTVDVVQEGAEAAAANPSLTNTSIPEMDETEPMLIVASLNFGGSQDMGMLVIA